MEIKKGEILKTFNTIVNNFDIYGLGKHLIYNKGMGINRAVDKNCDDLNDISVADKILNTGLDVNQWGSINSTVGSLGRINKDYEKIEYLLCHFNAIVNIIVAIPVILTNNIYIGFPSCELPEKMDKKAAKSISDNVCGYSGIPSEFILGYYIDGRDSIDFHLNNNHYSQLSFKDRMSFSERFTNSILTNSQIRYDFSEEELEKFIEDYKNFYCTNREMPIDISLTIKQLYEDKRSGIEPIKPEESTTQK